MQSEPHGNVVHHGVEVLLLVSMLFLLAIPKALLILKEFLYTIILVLLPTKHLRTTQGTYGPKSCMRTYVPSSRTRI